MIPKIVFYKFCFITFISYYPLASQDKISSLYFTGGMAATILDTGIGFSSGIVGLKKINQYIGLEAQINYTRAKISDSFISGRKGTTHAINTLAGLRLYFNPKDKYRFFVNGQLGGSLVKEKLNGLNLESEFTGGISLGAFVDFHDKYMAGVCLESPNFVILRFGYKFLSSK